LRHHSACLQLL